MILPTTLIWVKISLWGVEILRAKETWKHLLMISWRPAFGGLSALFFGYPKKKPPCRKEAFLLRPFDPHHPAVGLTLVIVNRFVIGGNTLFIVWLIQLIRKYTTCGGWFWIESPLEISSPSPRSGAFRKGLFYCLGLSAIQVMNVRPVRLTTT